MKSRQIGYGLGSWLCKSGLRGFVNTIIAPRGRSRRVGYFPSAPQFSSWPIFSAAAIDLFILMRLSAGDRLGHYEILSLLGMGGMGEVYRARDTKLKREVAIKVLPEAFARDPERMARFQREAEVLASLNHPNIATIHGVEDRALVMELVEGNSPKGPMPFDEAWKIASQIAAALEYAHERGIMHRDLKPANIMITSDGVVKLLDFGLAKAFSNQREPSASPENSPTLTLGATEVGVILGTAAYMAPEQARGKVVDKRADIWSFGVVLYELLTGERLFTGEDAAETLAAVIHKQPDLDKAPPQARSLLEECLQKDPKQRLRDIGDAWNLLAPIESAVGSHSLTVAASRLGALDHGWRVRSGRSRRQLDPFSRSTSRAAPGPLPDSAAGEVGHWGLKSIAGWTLAGLPSRWQVMASRARFPSGPAAARNRTGRELGVRSWALVARQPVHCLRLAGQA